MLRDSPSSMQSSTSPVAKRILVSTGGGRETVCLCYIYTVEEPKNADLPSFVTESDVNPKTPSDVNREDRWESTTRLPTSLNLIHQMMALVYSRPEAAALSLSPDQGRFVKMESVLCLFARGAFLGSHSGFDLSHLQFQPVRQPEPSQFNPWISLLVHSQALLTPLKYSCVHHIGLTDAISNTISHPLDDGLYIVHSGACSCSPLGK